MQLEEVRRRLISLPDPLPEPPKAIDARVIGQPGQLPAWIREAESAEPRRAASLVLMFPDGEGEAHLILMERPAGDLRHAGQISLPGGRIEPGEDFPVETALREAREEVGLDVEAAGIEVVGMLDVVDVRVSGFLMTPVVAIARLLPPLHADAREVASILLPPLDAFLPGAPIEIVEASRDGFRLRYGAYPVGGHQVWGATARVLGQLGAVIGAPDGTSGRAAIALT